MIDLRYVYWIESIQVIGSETLVDYHFFVVTKYAENLTYLSNINYQDIYYAFHLNNKVKSGLIIGNIARFIAIERQKNKSLVCLVS